MVESIFSGLVTLHAGTSPVTSQTVLTLMFVVLGIVIMGVGFGYIGKNKEALLQHRWTLTAALVLTLAPTFLVMVPTLFRFYTDPDVMVFSSISITQMVHTPVAIPALGTAIIYAFGKLPKNVKKSMRWTAALWVASIVIGVVLFLQIMELIPTF
jgi:uncharacterized membrane protein YozB (DUF420 family)